MHGTKIIGALFAILAAACLLLTGWIMHRSGALQGATEDGRWALGLAAILVHLILAVCGLAMFVSRKALVSLVCAAMMLGAAACSAWQIASFLATEVISVTKAREAAEKRESARVAAAAELAKERQKTQAELAKGQLKWLQGTERNADGRRERKDSFEAANKLVTDFAKVEAPAIPEAKVDATPLQSGVLAQWLAAKLGYDETALQASPSLMIALMLLLSEVVFWPLSSWFWNRPAPVTIRAFAAPPPMPEAPATALLAPPKSQAPRMGGNAPVSSPPVDLTPPPSGEKVARPPKLLPPPQAPRLPLPNSVQMLHGAGFPLIRPTGDLRPKEPPRSAAERFVLWARAMGISGTFSSGEQGELYTLYRECAVYDHREPIRYEHLTGALKRVKGISRTAVETPEGKRVHWEIAPAKFRPKVQGLPKEPEPTEQTEQRPDSEAEPEEGGVVTRPPFGVARLAGRPDGFDLGWLRRQQKHMRAMRIARNRKQRGSMITGWAA